MGIRSRTEALEALQLSPDGDASDENLRKVYKKLALQWYVPRLFPRPRERREREPPDRSALDVRMTLDL